MNSGGEKKWEFGGGKNLPRKRNHKKSKEWKRGERRTRGPITLIGGRIFGIAGGRVIR